MIDDCDEVRVRNLIILLLLLSSDNNGKNEKTLELDSPSSIDIPHSLSTPSLSENNNDTHHENLLPQLEADILEQQKLLKEKKKKDKINSNNTGIMSGIVNKLRQLTATSQPLELEEGQDDIIKIIPIKHRKPKHSLVNDMNNEQKNKIKDLDNDKHKFNDNKSKHNSPQRPLKQQRNSKSSKGALKMPALRDSVQHVVLYETSHVKLLCFYMIPISVCIEMGFINVSMI